MDRIQLDNIQFYGYHGVFPEETRLGQTFIVSLDLGIDLAAAGQSDDLAQTVNYATVYETVKGIVEGQPLKLIETLAETIARTLLNQEVRIQTITVRVKKPNPPFAAVFDGVTVEITRSR